jgi:hypothetical protein
MSSFKDKDGREWQVRIDAPSIMRIREECDAEFLKNDEQNKDNTFVRLRGDTLLLLRVIYILCQEQRDKREISEKDFYQEVIGDGDAIAGAADALCKAILSFSQPWMRTLLQTFTAETEMRQEAVNMITAKMADEETKTQFHQALENALAEVTRKALTQLGNVSATRDSLESAQED